MLRYWFLPLIGAGIGWVTNILAIRLLFRPYKAWKVPFLKFELQGLIPKRKAELARNIGRTIEKDLLSVKEVFKQLKDNDLEQQLEIKISMLVERRLQEKLNFLPSGLRGIMVDFFQELVHKEVAVSLQSLLEEVEERVVEDASLSQIVEKRIREFDLRRLEELVRQLAWKELRHIEYLGAVLGFIVGLGQALLLYLIY